VQVDIQPQLLETMVDHVVQRLGDKLADVRRLAVTTLKHLASEDPEVRQTRTSVWVVLPRHRKQG
jgi:hypothetical protein